MVRNEHPERLAIGEWCYVEPQTSPRGKGRHQTLRVPTREIIVWVKRIVQAIPRFLGGVDRFAEGGYVHELDPGSAHRFQFSGVLPD
jgi:hypothetical protein